MTCSVSKTINRRINTSGDYSISSLNPRVFVCVCVLLFFSVLGWSSWGLWNERQWRSPKGLERDMLRLISLPFNRMKYHSSCGMHPVSLYACLPVCLFVYMCARFVCLCVCVWSVLCQVGLWFLPLLLWGHIASLPSCFSILSNTPHADVCPLLHAGSHGCCGWFHVPSFPVADQGVTRA